VFLPAIGWWCSFNGDQGFCVDMSGHPLTMNYGLRYYGDLIYHWRSSGRSLQRQSALYHHQLNAPSAQQPRLGAIYESDGFTDIPRSSPPSIPPPAFKPKTTAVQ